MEDSEAHLTGPMPIDVCALSIILWQLWFKQAPFVGKIALAIIKRVANEAQMPSFIRPVLRSSATVPHRNSATVNKGVFLYPIYNI